MPPSASSPLLHLLPCQSARQVRLTRRRRGCSDGQLLLSLIYCFCVGGAISVASPACTVIRRHLRTTNPTEGVIGTVRLRTVKTRGCLSRKTGFAMVYWLASSAEGGMAQTRRDGGLAKVIEGVRFEDGIQVVKRDALTRHTQPLGICPLSP